MILDKTISKKQVKLNNMLSAESRLENILDVGQEIYCIIRHVSKSGMSRHISFFCIVNNEPRFLSGLIADYLDYKMNKYHDALVVGGCGMDMAFAVVYNLNSKLSHSKNTTYLEYHLKHRII